MKRNQLIRIILKVKEKHVVEHIYFHIILLKDQLSGDDL